MRIFRIVTEKGNVDLNITKAVSIKSPKKMFSLEEMKDGSFRLIWSESLIKDFSEIKELNIVREELNDDSTNN